MEWFIILKLLFYMGIFMGVIGGLLVYFVTKPEEDEKEHPIHRRLREEPRPILAAAIQVQKGYWTLDHLEKDYWLQADLQELDWNQLLRLNHCLCFALLSSEEGSIQWLGESFGMSHCPEGEMKELLKKVIDRLCSPESPYAPKSGHFQPVDPLNAPVRGSFYNPSITHLGAMELITLTPKGIPEKTMFVPFRDIQAVEFMSDDVFRLTRLSYRDDKADELFLAPLQYGFSWFTQSTHDKDGSITRFICDLQMDDRPQSAIALGQQELAIDSGGFPMLKGFRGIRELQLLETSNAC